MQTDRAPALIMAILMILSSFIFPVVITWTLGLFLIVYMALKWDLKGGLTAALGACLLMIIIFVGSAEAPPAREAVISLFIYLSLGIGLGRAIASIKETHRFLPNEEQLEKRKKIEAQLKESRAYNQSILEVIPEIIMLLDAEGTYLDIMTSSAEKLFMPREELLGRKISDILPPREGELYCQHIKKALATDKLQALEYSIPTPAGKLWFEARTIPMGDGEVISLIIDMTERKEAEEKIASYALQLERTNQRLDEEINKAKKVHEQTLPEEIPELDDFQIFAYYRPESGLGGDFYNYIKLEDSLLFYISDVTGHGLDAAMLSAFVKNTISTYIDLKGRERKPDPREVLNFIARQYVKENYPEDYFIAILLGVIDLKNKRLTYSSAGIHIPPVIFNPSGIIELPAGNMPISAVIPIEDLDFYNERAEIPPASTIFFSTDGLTEQMAGEEVYGERYRAVISESDNLPPVEIAERINLDFASFTGENKCSDDITYLIMKRADSKKVLQSG